MATKRFSLVFTHRKEREIWFNACMLKVKQSAIYGKGCFTLVPLNKRQRFAEYAGELIEGKRRIEARVKQQERRGIIKVIQLSEDAAIDAEVGGNATAYINHSCEPNAYMQGFRGKRVLFFALRDIAAGEEITIDYRDPYHPSPHACCCQARNCRSKKRTTR